MGAVAKLSTVLIELMMSMHFGKVIPTSERLSLSCARSDMHYCRHNYLKETGGSLFDGSIR